jgi:hypothetical protein
LFYFFILTLKDTGIFPMTQEKKHGFLRGLMKVFFFLLSACFILTGAALVRLYHEPLDLAFLQEDIEKSLKPSLGEVTLSFHKPVLVWRGLGFPLEVQTQNLSVENKKSHVPILKAPFVRFSFRFRSLLAGDLIPASLTIEEPQAVINLSQEESSQKNEPLLPFFEETFLTPSSSKTLKHFHVLKAHVRLQKGDLIWDMPEMSFNFERKHGGLHANFLAHISPTQSISTDLIYNPQDKHWAGTGKIENLELMPLLAHLSMLPGPWNGVRSQLLGSHITLSGDTSFSWNAEAGLNEGSFHLKAPQGILVLPPHLLPTALEYSQVNLSVLAHGGTLTLEDIDLTTKGAQMKGRGKAQLPSPQKPDGNLDLSFTLAHFSLPNLKDLWPKDVVPDARAWLVANLTQGQVPLATAEIKGILAQPQDSLLPTFHFKSITGKINLEKAVLTYLPGMPAVQNLTAHALYDQEHFDIEVKQGTSHKLNLSKGRVLIAGLSQETPSLSLKVLAQGELAQALDLIDHPPLKYLHDLPVSLKDGSGQIKTTFDLSFPLKDVLESKDFIFGVDADLENAAFKDILKAFPLSTQKGALQLKIKEGLLTCTGSTHINNEPSQLTLQQDITPKGTRASFVALKGQISPPGLKTLGADITPYASGLFPYTFKLDQKGANVAQITVKADLGSADLTYGAWKKDKGTAGALEAVILLKSGNLQEISHVRAHAPDLLLEASVHFTPKGDLKTATLKNFHLGKTQISGSLAPGKYKNYAVRIEGKALDLGPYIETLKDSKTSESALGKTFDVRLRLPEIYLSDAQTLYDNTLSLGYERERVQSLSYKGHFDPNLKKYFFADLIPRAREGRKFRLKCENGGALLKSFNLSRAISHGTLKLVAEQGPDPQDVWAGKLELDAFWIKDAPLLGRLLSLAFPTGLLDAFSGKGLQFERLKADFKLNAKRLVVQQGRAFGSSFGLSVKGSLDNHFTQLNFDGTIYPAYFINTALSKIPLIGKVLTGGKHEGLWGVSYTVTGPVDKPSIGVNPLSAFTPGILRKLFMPETNEDMDFEEEDLSQHNTMD